jgi:hypothetical protein
MAWRRSERAGKQGQVTAAEGHGSLPEGPLCLACGFFILFQFSLVRAEEYRRKTFAVSPSFDSRQRRCLLAEIYREPSDGGPGLCRGPCLTTYFLFRVVMQTHRQYN